ncbi:MAG: type II secretion system secretin GspD [Myxococcota bacterium]
MARFQPIARALLFAALAAVAQAQERPQAPVALEFRDAELTRVIATMAELTGQDFLYDPDEVSGRVSVIAPTAVSVDEAFRVFESMLHVRGLTTVPAPGGVLRIVPLEEADALPVPTLAPGAPPSDRDLYVTRLLPLDYLRAETLAANLRPLIPQTANLIAYAPTNTLIMTDVAANIRRIAELIGQVDIGMHRGEIRVLPIHHADASVLAAQLSEIFAGSAGQVRLIADERTNSIIAIATPALLRQVERLVPLIDYERRGVGAIRVYRLRNASAEELAQTLASLSASSPTSRPPSSATSSPGALVRIVPRAAAAALAGAGTGLRVVADAPTNSLIVQASPEAFAALGEVIEALDVRRPQVMVEALIMEVDVTAAEDLGIAGLVQKALGEGFFSIGIDPDDALPEPSGIPPIAGGEGVIGSTAEDFTVGVIGERVTVPGVGSIPLFQALLTASRSDSDLNLVSAPVILTADNEEAEIVVGEEIPVQTSREQRADFSSVGGFQTSQQIARQDVGVTLRVTPQVGEGDTVRLDIFYEVSQVQDTDPELGPTTTTRQLESSVNVRDGEAVVIGAGVRETRTEQEDRVPLLGDIPILGRLFRTTSETVRKVSLLVVLTAHIVREPDDLERLTLEQRERFRLEQPERFRLKQAGGSYRVQAAFFSDADAATSLLRDLIDLGYDGTVLSRSDRGEAVHFVQLGPYASQSVAQRVARELRHEADLRPLILVGPPER